MSESAVWRLRVRPSTPEGRTRNLQTALSDIGFKTAVDGHFGPATQEAIKKMQHQYGLPVTGKADTKTKQMLVRLAGQTPKQRTQAAAVVSKARAVKRQAAITRAQTPAPGEVAVLQRPKSIAASQRSATLKVTSKTAATAAAKTAQATAQAQAQGPQQQTKAQLSAKAATAAKKKIKAARHDEHEPDLQETTLAFGYGGDQSRSLIDARLMTPAADQPVWSRAGIRLVPDLAIPDSRPLTPSPSSAVIPDARPPLQPFNQVAALQVALMEAVKERKEATTGLQFTRARVREGLLRTRLAEAQSDLEEAIGPIKKGAFHAWLGKPLDQPITDADIARGKAAGGHPARMAHFAEQSRLWKHAKKAAKKAA